MTRHNLITFMVLVAIVASLGRCKKKDIDGLNVQPVYYNIPFEITSKDSFYLTDGPASVGIRLISIYDDRATGSLCSTSSGGQVDIKLAMHLNNSTVDTCLKSLPGCGNNQEFDTINPQAPRCTYATFRIHLLKLNPFDRKESDVAKYSVKYVIRKQ